MPAHEPDGITHRPVGEERELRARSPARPVGAA